MMLLAALIFGLNYIVGRRVVGDVQPYVLGFIRWTAGAIILLPLAWKHIRYDVDLINSNWKLLGLAGFLMPFMGAGVTYVALNYTDAVNAGVIQTSMPVMIVLLSWIFLRERTACVQWLGLVVAIAGVIYMIARGNPSALLTFSFNKGSSCIFCRNFLPTTHSE